MREDLTKSPAQPIDPIALARRDMQKPLPQRFYKEVGIAPSGVGFALTLDGRVAKTPGKSEFILPSAALAEAVAAEWRAQAEKIDFAAMPLTRLAFTAIDGVAHEMGAVIDEIAKMPKPISFATARPSRPSCAGPGGGLGSGPGFCCGATWDAVLLRRGGGLRRAAG